MLQLLTLLRAAHKQAVWRESSSTQTLLVAWESNNQDLIRSITASMMTLGGRHAPIKAAYDLFDGILNGGKIIEDYPIGIIPGFGCSFVKGHPDPILDSLDLYLRDFHADQHEACICDVRDFLRGKGKDIYPNLAAYTALVAHLNGEPYYFCESILLEARLPEWINVLRRYVSKEEKT